jgi:hypothetical protein
MAKTLEDIYIKNIENATRAIRLGTKQPSDVAHVATQFTKLKSLNEGMHDDLMAKYKNVVADHNKKTQK